ncbi:hypothetical protein F5X99DRAFT_263403 [Biscogniauxia marginata]|nr:hypothetical protein F5X99DRAFT_263403 [Biscogniauxia marginata]
MAVEIVTIVNQSGKVISNGKHILNVFKEARATYQEKKAALKVERAIKRSQTFDVPTEPRYEDEVGHGYIGWQRRTSLDDDASRASSRRSHRSRSSKHRSVSESRPALTEGNLKTHSEVSSTAPSRVPTAYKSSYAETALRAPTLGRGGLTHAPTMPTHLEDAETIVPSPRQGAYVHGSRSDPSIRENGGKGKKEIDMDLAYGNVPPDLEERVDLDPAYKSDEKELEAEDLVDKIENILTEAHCLHHTATHIIQHLQDNPEAAAAVALALAELSALLGKMSPSFLGILKGGSPAIFALLASPQFLIAAGVTVGVTVVMFGGWKIIKRIQEGQEANAMRPMAFRAQSEGPSQVPYPPSEVSQGFDVALVVEEELSSIETWRRGIAPFGEDEVADLELISPEADRAMRGDDARSIRTSRTHKTSKTSKTSKSHKSHKPHRSRRDSVIDDDDASERKSAVTYKERDDVSESGTHRSHRSHRTEKTERPSRSKRGERVELRAIDDGSKDKENTLESVVRPKKDSMLKSLFKKRKDHDEKQRVSSVVR